MDLKIEYFDDGTYFQAIDPLMINPEYLTNFSLFERFPSRNKQYRFRSLLTDMDSMSVEKLSSLLESWETVYVHKKHLRYYTDHIKDNLDYILKHETIDIKKKTQAFASVFINVIKDVFDSNFHGTIVSPDSINELEQLISQIIEFIQDINSLNGLADLIGHDYDTHAHSLKVAWLLAAFINCNRDLFPKQSNSDFKRFVLKATVAGIMHDIGKIKIPKNILNKKGKLDNIEYITVQSHTAYSLSLLYESGLPKFVMQTILYHHENEDGSGYPCGLKNEQIPILAKIIHIADVFEALTAKRPYKEAKTPFEALKIMSGTNPHAEVLGQFEKEVRENKKVHIQTIVRNEPDIKLRRLREKEMMEEEAKKKVEARLKLRDQGMAHCFDRELMKKFIIMINHSENFDLSSLL